MLMHIHTHSQTERHAEFRHPAEAHKAHDRTKRSANRTYPDWMSFRMHFPVHRYLKNFYVCMCVVYLRENLSRNASADGCTVSRALDCTFVILAGINWVCLAIMSQSKMHCLTPHAGSKK